MEYLKMGPLAAYRFKVDNGTFRLVPNDYEVESREGREGDTVPDIQGKREEFFDKPF